MTRTKDRGSAGTGGTGEMDGREPALIPSGLQWPHALSRSEFETRERMVNKVLRVFGLFVMVGGLLVGWQFGWGLTLGISGLLMDIIGASLLTIGVLARWAPFYKIGSKSVRGDRSFWEWWVLDFPIALASTVGSSDAKTTDPNHERDFTDQFWGLVFLVFGFIGQLCSQLMSQRG